MIDQEGINSLNTGAEAITYEGTEGPKSPEQDQAIALGIPEGLTLDEAIRTFDLAVPEKANLKGMEKLQEVIEFFKTRTLSGGQPLPEDPTKPINPFGPKPTGPVLPREMAAFGGIMGLDQRRQYGIGSKLKRAFNKVTRPFTKVAQKLMPKELAGIAQYASPFLGPIAGPLAYAAGAAKQKGRINPFSLAMMAAPYIRKTPEGFGFGQATDFDKSYGIRDLLTGGKKGGYYEELGKKGLLENINLKDGNLGQYTDEFLFGKPEGINTIENLDGTKELGDAAGLIGSEGEMYQLFPGEGSEIDGLLSTKLGSTALATGKDATKISKLKLGSWAIGIVSGIQAGKYADEQAAADAAEEAALAADSEASEATLAAARAWAIETFGSMNVYAEGMATGGRINKNMGGEMDMGGISSLQTQASDVTPPGMELDLRGGGFIPIGTAEKADDVPARVSKNEFVFTADAVKAAGGGSVNEGAKKMYDTMKRLESQVG